MAKGKGRSQTRQESKTVQTSNGHSQQQLPQIDARPKGYAPHQQLELETLIEDYVWIIPNFFTKRECQQWMAYADPLMELTAHRATRYMAHRECFRYSVNSNEVAQQIFERLQSMCPESIHLLQSKAIGCNPNIRLYKYEKHMSFGKHIDESNSVSGGMTRFTILIYLSDCEGGATRFEPPLMGSNRKGKASVAFPPTVGSLLLHLHGDDCLTHEADPVMGGVKYVLRTDLVCPY